MLEYRPPSMPYYSTRLCAPCVLVSTYLCAELEQPGGMDYDGLCHLCVVFEAGRTSVFHPSHSYSPRHMH